MYNPKFKLKELRQIARQISSTDDYKSDIDPVHYDWHPDQDLVYLHMEVGLLDDKRQPIMYKLAYPMRPFVIGFKAWQAELFAHRDARIRARLWIVEQKEFLSRARKNRARNQRRRKKAEQ